MARKTKAEEDEEVEDISGEEKVALKAINDDRVKLRVAEYYSDFDIETLSTIDKSQIRYLAKIELAAEDTTDALMTVTSPNQRKMLSDSAKALIAESRQLADTLGMSRKSRTTGDGAELESYLPRLYKEVEEFMNERAIAIVCPKCLDTKERRRIHMGSIIYPFAFETEWKWVSKCPKCEETFEINEHNYFDFLFKTVNADFEDVKTDRYAVDGEPMSQDDEI